jgi:alpha-ketoglutaric semialdehyde dehydrogenase
MAKKPKKKAKKTVKKTAKKKSKAPKKVKKTTSKKVKKPIKKVKTLKKKVKSSSKKKQTSKKQKKTLVQPKTKQLSLIQEVPERYALLSTETYNIRNLINGTWKNSASGFTFQSINPADQKDLIAKIAKSNYKDVKEAIESAKLAFKEWSEANSGIRAKILFQTVQNLESNKEFISNLIVREVGFTKAEADAEVKKAISTAYYLAGEGSRLESVFVDGNNSNDNYMKKEPLGTFAIITPWCSPLEIPVNKLFSALVSGNTVVFKPAQEASACAMFLCKYLEQAGLPDGVVNMVTGSGSELGTYLIGHNDINGVSFTGCSNVGKLIGGSCGSRFKRHELHLGDKSSMIVLADADIKNAVNSALIGSFRYAGQRCNSTSRIIVLNKIYDNFVKKFVNETKKLIINLPSSKDVDLGPVVSERSLSKVKEMVRVGRNEDRATMACGGGRFFSGKCKEGFFYEPTVFVDVTPNMGIAQEEILGPVVCIMRARNESEAIKMVNDSRYGLVASVFTSSISKAHNVANELQVGVVNINAPTTYSEVEVPFGGRKDSGNGSRTGGATSLDTFTELKVVSVNKE